MHVSSLTNNIVDSYNPAVQAPSVAASGPNYPTDCPWKPILWTVATVVTALALVALAVLSYTIWADFFCQNMGGPIRFVEISIPIGLMIYKTRNVFIEHSAKKGKAEFEYAKTLTSPAEIQKWVYKAAHNGNKRAEYIVGAFQLQKSEQLTDSKEKKKWKDCSKSWMKSAMTYDHAPAAGSAAYHYGQAYFKEVNEAVQAMEPTSSPEEAADRPVNYSWWHCNHQGNPICNAFQTSRWVMAIALIAFLVLAVALMCLGTDPTAPYWIIGSGAVGLAASFWAGHRIYVQRQKDCAAFEAEAAVYLAHTNPNQAYRLMMGAVEQGDPLALYMKGYFMQSGTAQERQEGEALIKEAAKWEEDNPSFFVNRPATCYLSQDEYVADRGLLARMS